MELVRGIGLSVLAVLVFGLLFVLPGVRWADRLAGNATGWMPRLILSVVVSQVILAVTGVVLIAVGRFSGVAVAVVAAVFAVTSLPAALRWARGAQQRRWSLATLGWATALTIPWMAILGSTGWRPADTLQWYYADLGSQLTRAGGIPTSVAEWGLPVRWLPDYLVFNVDSEAYLAWLGFLPRADALAAWRVPVTLMGIVVLFAVLRSWVGRPAALAGTALIAGSAFYLAKFDAYKPEAFGIVLGLAALWLVVRGLRSGRRSWVLLGGACLGLGLSIHAIAATVMGLLVAGFGAAEWIALRGRRAERATWLVRAALLGLLISVLMGVGLQGRAVVAGAALNPGAAQRAAQGADPTWTFFLRSTGDFTVPEPRPPTLPLAGGVTTPWAGLQITSAFGWWLIPSVAIGVFALAALRGRRARAGLLGLAASTALLGAGIAFFALEFHTYVPRWTGLVRFGQYLPLLVGMSVTFALAGYLRLWAWLAEMRIPRAFALVAALVGVAWLVPQANARYASELGIKPDGRAALAALGTMGSSGDVVLSNALTTGTLESFTGLEAPLEGRQPLIEDPAFLSATNRFLLDAHDWFAQPADRGFLDRLGVRWLLVTDDPTTLGTAGTLGGSVAGTQAVSGLRVAWSGVGVALLEVPDPARAAVVVDDPRPIVDLPRAALVAGVGIVAGLLLIAPFPWRRRRTARETP